MTHKLNDYNEIYNVNSYLQGANSQDLQRLAGVNDTLRTRILRLKQEYMLYDHGINEFGFRINIVYFTGVIVCIVLFMAALFQQDRLSGRLALTISTGLFVVYCLIVLLVVKSNADRRKYSYHQYYWKQVEKKK
jgi:hypothetical protein